MPCIIASLLSLLSSLRFQTDSEDEELDKLQNLLLGLCLSTSFGTGKSSHALKLTHLCLLSLP